MAARNLARLELIMNHTQPFSSHGHLLAHPRSSTRQGFILIEALVSLVVVTVGVLGMAKLNAVVLQGTGGSKARLEAANLAQHRMEQARDFVLKDGCADTAIADGTISETNVAGVAAAYAITTTLSSATHRKNVEVCVTWDGGTCGATGNRILLSSVVACDGVGTSGLTGDSGPGKRRGGFVKTPTSRADVGGGDHIDPTTIADADKNKITLDGTNQVNDGTHTRVVDGRRELIDITTGKVLLTVKSLGCESNIPPDFSTISGKVFVARGESGPLVSASNLFMMSSDASFCTVLPYDETNWVLPQGETGSAIEYYYTYYRCYVGAEWRGNVGLIVQGGGAGNGVCVGNPVDGVMSPASLYSRHAQLGSTRGYRAFREVGDSVVMKGIGETDVENTACSTSRKKIYNYTATHFDNHHFVYANLSGENTCQTRMEALNNMNAPSTVFPHKPLAKTDGTNFNPIQTANPLTFTAVRNPGKYYCMSSKTQTVNGVHDGISCP